MRRCLRSILTGEACAQAGDTSDSLHTSIPSNRIVVSGSVSVYPDFIVYSPRGWDLRHVDRRQSICLFILLIRIAI